jgi:hypothetical protein
VPRSAKSVFAANDLAANLSLKDRQLFYCGTACSQIETRRSIFAIGIDADATLVVSHSATFWRSAKMNIAPFIVACRMQEGPLPCSQLHA